jgi:DNA modification methylase
LTARLAPTAARIETIGNATLYLADCRDVLPFLKADAVITDPPYEILSQFGTSLTGKSKGKRVMQFDFDTDGVFDECVLPAVRMAVRNATGRCGHFVFAAPDHISKLYPLFRDLGLTPKPAVWIKPYPPPPMPGNWWVSAHETALYAYKTGAWFGDNSARRPNVFSFDTYRYGMPGKVAHPTQKPEKLMEKICAALLPEDAIALDPFMGSGSTGVAAINLGRKFIGIEIEPKYFEIACERIDAAQRQMRLDLVGLNGVADEPRKARKPQAG